MKSKVIIPATIVVVLLAAIVIVLFRNNNKIKEKANAIPQVVSAMPVKAASVVLKHPDNTIELSGSFEARQTLPLVSAAQGSIVELKIKKGQSIRAGEVVARIDPTSVQSNLATAQAAYNNAVKNKERFERLVEAGAISQKQYEDVALNVENARANVNSIQQQMKYTIIHSPISGTVSDVKVEKGSFASPGTQLGSVVDISTLKMVLNVSEQDVIKLKKGQSASVQTEVYPNHIFNGTISSISVQADAGRKYGVEVEVPNNSNTPLKAGMFGTAKLSSQNNDKSDKLYIPREAIVGSIQNPQVFVLNNDSTVTLKNIEAQDQNGNEIIVLKGLRESETVITSGLINLQTGTKVRIVK